MANPINENVLFNILKANQCNVVVEKLINNGYFVPM